MPSHPLADLTLRCRSLGKRTWIRHFSALILFGVSIRLLSIWYLYQNVSIALFSWMLFLLAIALVAGSHLVHYWKKRSWFRIALVLFLLILCLPWGEWLNLSYYFSRYDWTRQIFLQTILLYLLIGFFHLVPSVSFFIQKRTIALVQSVSNNRIFPWIIFALFFSACVFIGYSVYGRTPLTGDSAAYLFQAKIFSHFRLVAPEPRLAEFFTGTGDQLVTKNGKWFSMYTPGYSLLLALAMFLHSEWLLSPLLGALTVLIWMTYADRWYNKEVSLLVGVLCLFSPLMLLHSSIIMIHAPEMFIAAATIYFCRAETEGTQSWRRFMLIILLAWAVLVRAFSLLIFLTPVLIYTGFVEIKARKWVVPVSLAGGILIGVALLAFFQYEDTQNPLLTGYQLEYPQLRMGFFKTQAENHSPLRALENTSNNILGFNLWLSGWPIGSILFLMMYIFFKRRYQIWEIVIACGAVALVTFYFFYFFQDLLLGPRYFLIFAPFAILLISRTIWNDGAKRNAFSARFMGLFVFCLIGALPVNLPGLVKSGSVSNLASGYLNREIHELGNQKAIIFLDPYVIQRLISWNDPFLREPVLICRDLGALNSKLESAYPDHSVYYFREDRSVNLGFSLFSEPRRKARQDIFSLFMLTLNIQAAGEHPDKDFFDVCFENRLVVPDSAELQLKSLDLIPEPARSVPKYKTHFQKGLKTTARLLLVPALLFKNGGPNWSRDMDYEVFRQEFVSAKTSFESAGEVGKDLLIQLEKVQMRMDTDRDGVISDSEIQLFLSSKLNDAFKM